MKNIVLTQKNASKNSFTVMPLPNQTKVPESCLSIFTKGKQFQDGKMESVKTSSRLL